MMVTWALFGLWLAFTLLDLTISGLAIRFGAREGGLIYQLPVDWNMASFIKGIGAFLLGLVLFRYNQRELLVLACLIYFGICLYNAVVLWRQISG